MMQGSCLCGAVQFQVDAPLRPVILCHCTQCRKSSGHVWAASSVPMEQFRLLRDAGLQWYASSDKAERGFCAGCGASLFWKPLGEDRISFAAGALDGPTGLVVASQWHMEDAGDYYTTPRPARMLSGSCLCGANLFTVDGAMGAVTGCHCDGCRKTSGHHAAMFEVDEEELIWSTRAVRDHATPQGGARGFCSVCGSSLYVRTADGGFSVMAGVIDAPTGGRLTLHRFVAQKGDWYELDDGLPQAD